MTRTAAASPAVYREHPIKILRYSAKNLWLLIFPLLRSLSVLSVLVSESHRAGCRRVV